MRTQLVVFLGLVG